MQLAERELDRAWVERVVRAPSAWEPDPGDPDLIRLFGRVPERGDRMLRVVLCMEAGTRCRIITVHLDRNAGRRQR